MKFGSVCSGIEAASVAWKPLGWECAWVSEIEKFPCSTLKHRYPDIPNFGDMTKFKEWPSDGKNAIDLLAGGTPCQSFSNAGLRRGLDDPRGNLMLVYLGVLDKYRPRWCFWENVPGVLSSKKGRDFGAFLGALGELGYSCAWRVLDAQKFGVPQRRRRVYVVGHLGDWRGPAAILFDSQSLQGDSPARGKKRKEAAGNSKEGSGGESGVFRMRGFGDYVAETGGASTLKARDARDAVDLVVYSIDSEKNPMRDKVGTIMSCNKKGTGDLAILAFTQNQEGEVRCGEVAGTLNTNSNASGRNAPLIAFPERMSGTQCAAAENVSAALTAKNQMAFATRWIIRRFTPRECERLQGFPDDYTLIPHRGKPAKDGPRYKAIGNSWAVPVPRWIGERIQIVDEILKGLGR